MDSSLLIYIGIYFQSIQRYIINIFALLQGSELRSYLTYTLQKFIFFPLTRQERLKILQTMIFLFLCVLISLFG